MPVILAPSKRWEVIVLVQKLWIPENRKTTVCVDSYENGILTGRFYGANQEEESFCSLSQFLVMMDEMLEHNQAPQSYTAPRRFSNCLHPGSVVGKTGSIRRGMQATFELQILFRQHTSWQGVVVWKEQRLEQSFRSVLELILLMDSALRDMAGKEAI